MARILLAAALLAWLAPTAVVTIGLAQTVHAREQVTLTASDGVKVYADFYPADEQFAVLTYCCSIKLARTALSMRQSPRDWPKWVLIALPSTSAPVVTCGARRTKPSATSAMTESTQTPLRTWKRLWRGQSLLETMAMYWCGAAAIRLLWSFCLPLITAKRSPECLLFLQASTSTVRMRCVTPPPKSLFLSL